MGYGFEIEESAYEFNHDGLKHGVNLNDEAMPLRDDQQAFLKKISKITSSDYNERHSVKGHNNAPSYWYEFTLVKGVVFVVGFSEDSYYMDFSHLSHKWFLRNREKIDYKKRLSSSKSKNSQEILGRIKEVKWFLLARRIRCAWLYLFIRSFFVKKKDE